MGTRERRAWIDRVIRSLGDPILVHYDPPEYPEDVYCLLQENPTQSEQPMVGLVWFKTYDTMSSIKGSVAWGAPGYLLDWDERLNGDMLFLIDQPYPKWFWDACRDKVSEINGFCRESERRKQGVIEEERIRMEIRNNPNYWKEHRDKVFERITDGRSFASQDNIGKAKEQLIKELSDSKQHRNTKRKGKPCRSKVNNGKA